MRFNESKILLTAAKNEFQSALRLETILSECSYCYAFFVSTVFNCHLGSFRSTAFVLSRSAFKDIKQILKISKKKL